MADRIGERLAAWRRRRGGMSQAVLAGLSGLSQAYISQIESGKRPLDRKATQVAIASALNISVAQLLGACEESEDPMRSRALVHIPAIRSALVEMTAGERRTPTRDADATRAAVRLVTDLRNAADYAGLAPLLPGLLLDLGGHEPDLAPELVETLFCVRYALKSMGRSDLAMMAADLGVRVSERYGDPAWRGQALYSWVQSFPPENAALGARITARAADDLQGVSDRGAQEVYGCLHILSAFTSSIDNRPDDAAAHLDEAESVARSLGDPERYSDLSAGFNANWFGPAQVDFWRVAVAAELGDAGTAISVVDRVDLEAMPVPNRHVYLWTDLARALVAGEQDREAVHALAKAERAAPQHFRFSPITKDLLATMITRAKRKSVEGEITTLARRLGLDPI